MFQLKEKIERNGSSVKAMDTEPNLTEKKTDGMANFVYRNDSTPQLEVKKNNLSIKSILSQKSFNIAITADWLSFLKEAILDWLEEVCQFSMRLS